MLRVKISEATRRQLNDVAARTRLDPDKLAAELIRQGGEAQADHMNLNPHTFAVVKHALLADPECSRPLLTHVMSVLKHGAGWLRVRDAAGLLGVSPQRIYQLISQGKVVHKRTAGNSIVVWRESLHV